MLSIGSEKKAWSKTTMLYNKSFLSHAAALVLSLALVASGKVWGAGDADGDGYAVPADCNDNDANINPAVAETCDGIDNDCDGQVDEDGACDGDTADTSDTGGCKDPSFWCFDADLDGYGDPTRYEVTCEAPEGYVADCTDCDDTSFIISPSSEECENDGIDWDCDGQQDWCMVETGDTAETGLPKVGNSGGDCRGCATAPSSTTWFLGGLMSLLMLLRRRRS